MNPVFFCCKLRILLWNPYWVKNIFNLFLNSNGTISCWILFSNSIKQFCIFFYLIYFIYEMWIAFLVASRWTESNLICIRNDFNWACPKCKNVISSLFCYSPLHLGRALCEGQRRLCWLLDNTAIISFSASTY